MILFSTLKVAYLEVPKVASTSLSKWLYRVMFGHDFEPVVDHRGNLVYIHDHLRSGRCPGVEERPAAEVRKLPPDWFVFCVVREPVRRFLSAYSNRVLFYKELDEGHREGKLAKAAGLKPRPDIGYLVDHIESYVATAPSVGHHIRPMVSFIGDEPTAVARVVDVSHLNALFEELRRHLQASGVARDLIERPLGREQTGGAKLGLEVLEPESLGRLLRYYDRDYAVLPNYYTPEAIIEAWRQARATAGKKNEAIDTAMSSQKAMRRRQEITAREFPVLRIYLDQANVASAGPGLADLGGVIVLDAGVQPRDYRLVVQDKTGEHVVEWHLPSPKIGEALSDHPHAAHARFRARGIDFANSPGKLLLRGENGQTPLARWDLVIETT
ncbi:sulfotransferase family 2 domain-containing protein [Sulfurisoma sediminicola]|uniref:Sulfotransferase family protein n=1 Tax=Sulfurisoma sediminicola TaxID=1381557 RepID=A0A497XIC0_9PROT|nr:sulfotransferase family 2 domain-containing protein [Sulfurisoma sediminicola]RLJ67611.1 sulfotransferase family protein [Sulfurisoma sediminicola]